MKKAVLIVIALMITFSAMSQDVTKFLGIPIDGFKRDMISKLEAKGYVYDKVNDLLEGEFNGKNVYIRPVTNNNKVYRIAVWDQNTTDETNVKIQFNKLCSQFDRNQRYTSEIFDQTLGEDVDISYEISVHKKRFEASYYQISSDDEIVVPNYNKSVWFMICEKYGKYYIMMFYDNCLNQANGEDL